MQNVIAFPKAAVESPAPARATGAKTLFLHIRSTTLIVHLSGTKAAAETGTKVGKRV